MMTEPSPEKDGGDASTVSAPGPSLRFWQIGWVVATAIAVGLNIIALPDLYGSYFTYSPTVLHELHQIGLSPTVYSVLGIIQNSLIFQIVYLLLGLLLFLRRPNDRMALFCAFTLVTFGSAVTYYNFSTGDVVPSLQANPIVHLLALVLFGVGEASFVVFFYLFPSGRFAPRWTRWAALIVAAYYVAVIFFPALPSNAGGPATLFIPLYLVSAAVAQVYRYRRVSTPREQEQTKWVVFGFVLAILLIALNFPIGLLLPASVTNNQVLSNLNPVFPLALMMVPIFIVIAILRSRLWDIDTLINRALVYGSLTALLAALYAGLIVGLQHLTGMVATPFASNPVILVASTLAIAALFQPLRIRLQSIIDRAFYRRKYDAEKTLSAFGRSLGQEVDLEQIQQQLLAVAAETMQPNHVSLWLRPTEPRPAEQAHHLGSPSSPSSSVEAVR